MNGTSGVQEVRSSPSRSPSYRFLHEQRHQFGTGAWILLRTHDLITLSTGISTKRGKVPDTIFNLGRTEGVSQVCLTLILMMIAILEFPAYVWSAGPPPPSGEHPLHLEHLSAGKIKNEPLCQLVPPITTVDKQESSAWCWAASTHLVIKHLEPLRNLSQCQTVYNTLAPGSSAVDCCLVTDEAMKTANTSDPKVQNSIGVCWSNAYPGSALDANGYWGHYAQIIWGPSNTPPEGPGLTWEELTGQICSNRPFISMKHWNSGGTHTEVITGNHYNGPEPWVDLDTHGLDTFFSEPYEDYKSKPGYTGWVHVRDYIDIGM